MIMKLGIGKVLSILKVILNCNYTNQTVFDAAEIYRIIIRKYSDARCQSTASCKTFYHVLIPVIKYSKNVTFHILRHSYKRLLYSIRLFLIS